MKLIEIPKAQKKDEIERLLEAGIVMIFVDTRKPGVIVPPAFQNTHKLPLNISYTYQIPDFKVLPDRVEVTLTFPDGPFFCIIPLDSVYVLTSYLASETIVFPEDFPQEYMPHFPGSKGTQEDPKEIDIGPSLTVVHGDEVPAEAPKSEKKRGHLKLVQ